MYKIVLFVSMLACCYAAPAPGLIAAAPVVTATSSQVVARNYNAAFVAPAAVPVAAPIVAAPVVKAAPFVAPAVAPFAYSAAPGFVAPAIAPYSAYPYASYPYVI